MMDRAFGRALKRIRPEVGEGHRRVPAGKISVWRGVGLQEVFAGRAPLSEEAGLDVPDVHDVPLFHDC